MQQIARITRSLLAFCALLLLSGCLLIPGKFNSELRLMNDGIYSFSYSGEIQFFDPDNNKFGRSQSYAPFNEKSIKCYNRIDKKTGEIEPQDYQQFFRVSDVAYDEYPYRFEKRECSSEEIEKERNRYDSDIASRKTSDNEKMAMFGAMLGGAVPGNDAKLQAFARQLEKYDGWNRVEYLGDDKFMVEYAISGRFDQNFGFPSIPGSTMQFPFVQIIRRTGGELEILTPAMAGPGGLFGSMMFGKNATPKDMPDISSIDGTFKIETNGEILSNNSEDGYAASGSIKTMAWQIGGKPFPGEGPRAIVKLSE